MKIIYWLIQSSLTHKHLSTEQVLPGLLTSAEQAFFDRLKSDKRRHDWLLGRWTGKCLIQRLLGGGIPLNAIEILAAEDGAPEVSVQFSGFSAQSMGGKLVTLSISHSADRAFCAVVEGVGIPLGVDIERIEERTEGFVRDYFVREEIVLVETTPREMRAGVVTAIWSAKEAALKAIRVGLLADTFAVRCLPQGDGIGWCSVSIEWDMLKLKRAAPALAGWWCIEDGFVLGIALAQSLIPSTPERLDTGGLKNSQ